MLGVAAVVVEWAGGRAAAARGEGGGGGGGWLTLVSVSTRCPAFTDPDFAWDVVGKTFRPRMDGGLCLTRQVDDQLGVEPCRAGDPGAAGQNWLQHPIVKPQLIAT